MYARLVGEAWDVLPAIVRNAHAPGVAQGRLRVRRGAGLLARWLGFAMRLPSAGDAVPVRLEILPEGDGLL